MSHQQGCDIVPENTIEVLLPSSRAVCPSRLSFLSVLPASRHSNLGRGAAG